jgi:hypothetical protein
VHKRLADEVLQHDKHKVQPWRRSGCWLVIRVLLQTSCASRDAYKAFMVHLHTLFLQDCVRAKLDSDVVFAVRAKMARRLYKLRNSVDVPKRVVEAAHSAAADAEGLLRDRWTRAERESARMLKWTPDDFNLIDDTNLKLVNRYCVSPKCKFITTEAGIVVGSTFTVLFRTSWILRRMNERISPILIVHVRKATSKSTRATHCKSS